MEPGTSEWMLMMTRLERLEKQNRSMKQIGALVLVLIAASVLVALPTAWRGKLFSHSSESHNWLIESYDNGVITVEHDGYTYKATFHRGWSVDAAKAVTDPNGVVEFSSCHLAIGLVGYKVQPFGGQQKDSNGNGSAMWQVGSTLVLRSWHDEHTPWRQEEFEITSVTKSR